MRALIELIQDARSRPMAMPEVVTDRLPKCVREIRFEITRAFSEKDRTAKFRALVAVQDGAESFVLQIIEPSWVRLRKRLRTTLTQIEEFELQLELTRFRETAIA